MTTVKDLMDSGAVVQPSPHSKRCVVVDATPIPTDRPLTAEDVALLREGDVLRCVNPNTIAHRQGQIYVFASRTHHEPGEGNDIIVKGDRLSTWSGIFTFLGRPDADGWIEWHGGENPVGHGVEVEVRSRQGEWKAMSQNIPWKLYADIADIIAYRVSRPTSGASEGGSVEWQIARARQETDVIISAGRGEMRPETLSEHIARDMRNGVFPQQSEPQMVPLAPSPPVQLSEREREAVESLTDFIENNGNLVSRRDLRTILAALTRTTGEG